MATNTAPMRLKGDYMEMIKDPMPHIRVAPSPENILLWHYVMIGKKGSPFEGGYYHGTIRFAPEYPFKPPHYVMNVENGRFQVGKEICTTNSHYHKESWSPLWNVNGILCSFIEFFHDTKQVGFIGSAGCVQNEENYKKFASESKNRFIGNQIICDLFPDIADQIKKELNGAEPTHTLPIPPEHYEMKKKISEREKAIEIEKQAIESVLTYDSYPEDSDGDEE